MKVDALRQILGSAGPASRFKVTREMTEARDQSGAGTVVVQRCVGISTLLPFRPMASRAGSRPIRDRVAQDDPLIMSGRGKTGWDRSRIDGARGSTRF